MKVWLFTFCLTLIAITNSNAQGFKQGDIILNGNYGGPQVTPAVLRTALKVYYKTNKNPNDNFSFAISNSGVLNGKAEYGATDEAGLGFAVSYWDMAINVKNNYQDVDPTDNTSKSFEDNYDFKVSALAMGLRGNYHFVEEGKMKKIDPYLGFTLGATQYKYDLAFTTNYPNKTLPVNAYKFKSGWGSYISTTIGIRYYPVSFIGLNAEAGWDRGAFLFGGIVFRLHSKPPKFLREDEEKK
jgi:hypothetical protein